jgi:nuclear pore complex protein Nup133
LFGLQTQTFVASTSIGRLFRLVLTSTGGKYHLTSHPFSRPQVGLSLTRIFPLWSSSVPQTECGYINSVPLGKQTTGGREIWTIIDTRVQIWSMTFEGFEELVTEEELGTIIQRAIQDAVVTASKNGSELDLELLDVIVERFAASIPPLPTCEILNLLLLFSSVKAVFLVSYAGLEETYGMVAASQPKRSYALVGVSLVSDVFKVDSVKSVPYQSVSQPILRFLRITLLTWCVSA